MTPALKKHAREIRIASLQRIMELISDSAAGCSATNPVLSSSQTQMILHCLSLLTALVRGEKDVTYVAGGRCFLLVNFPPLMLDTCTVISLCFVTTGAAQPSHPSERDRGAACDRIQFCSNRGRTQEPVRVALGVSDAPRRNRYGYYLFSHHGVIHVHVSSFVLISASSAGLLTVGGKQPLSKDGRTLDDIRSHKNQRNFTGLRRWVWCCFRSSPEYSVHNSCYQQAGREALRKGIRSLWRG